MILSRQNGPWRHFTIFDVKKEEEKMGETSKECLRSALGCLCMIVLYGTSCSLSK